MQIVGAGLDVEVRHRGQAAAVGRVHAAGLKAEFADCVHAGLEVARRAADIGASDRDAFDVDLVRERWRPVDAAPARAVIGPGQGLEDKALDLALAVIVTGDWPVVVIIGGNVVAEFRAGRFQLGGNGAHRHALRRGAQFQFQIGGHRGRHRDHYRTHDRRLESLHCGRNLIGAGRHILDVVYARIGRDRLEGGTDR